MKKARGLRAIAEAAGVSVATVSLALRGHPRISAQVRRRVEREAKRAGYRVDPTVSDAMARLREADPNKYKGTLGYLTPKLPGQFPTEAWRARMLESAKRRAERLGYAMEKFDLEGGRLSPERLSAVIHARGIRGVLIAPLERPRATIPLCWDLFVAVALGHTLETPDLHRVGRSLFHPLLELFGRLHEAGYRRIGLCVDSSANLRMGRVLEAAALVHHPDKDRSVPPLIVDQPVSVPASPAQVRLLSEWLEAHRPDVVIGEYETMKALSALGHEFPRDLGFATWNRDRDDRECAGIYARFETLASSAVDLLVHAVEEGATGLPENPQLVLIDGEWSWGRTLRTPGGVQAV